MPVCCHCSICKGTFVALHTKRNHDRTALKNQMVLQQNVWRPGLASVDPIRGISSTTIPSHLGDTQGPPSLDINIDTLGTSNPFVDLEDGALLHMDFDVITSPANHNNHLGSDPVILQFNQININSCLVGEDQGAMCQGVTFLGLHRVHFSFSTCWLSLSLDPWPITWLVTWLPTWPVTCHPVTYSSNVTCPVLPASRSPAHHLILPYLISHDSSYPWLISIRLP